MTRTFRGYDARNGGAALVTLDDNPLGLPTPGVLPARVPIVDDIAGQRETRLWESGDDGELEIHVAGRVPHDDRLVGIEREEHRSTQLRWTASSVAPLKPIRTMPMLLGCQRGRTTIARAKDLEAIDREVKRLEAQGTA